MENLRNHKLTIQSRAGKQEDNGRALTYFTPSVSFSSAPWKKTITK